MTKTIVGSIAVIFCSLLLMPLLVDTVPPFAAVAKPVVHQVVVAGLVRGR